MKLKDKLGARTGKSCFRTDDKTLPLVFLGPSISRLQMQTDHRSQVPTQTKNQGAAASERKYGEFISDRRKEKHTWTVERHGDATVNRLKWVLTRSTCGVVCWRYLLWVNKAIKILVMCSISFTTTPSNNRRCRFGDGSNIIQSWMDFWVSTYRTALDEDFPEENATVCTAQKRSGADVKVQRTAIGVTMFFIICLQNGASVKSENNRRALHLEIHAREWITWKISP